ncbi:RNA recognition motif domain-containing protein [Phthorimaea operculella]|nr:RNA recognition motif domain-containing protein [Phthorimaea operculella]
MKSKSFDLRKSPSENGKANKTFDFVGLYKSAAETNVKLLSKPKTVENLDKENNFGTPVNTTSKKREGSPNKKKKKSKHEPLDISHINSDEQGSHAVTAKKTPSGDTHATSTPYASRKTVLEPSVKSIMKNCSHAADDATASSASETPVSKPKKRNKSVSFMLDDTEEIATKKTKSEETVPVSEKAKTKKKYDDKKKLKKHKKNQQKENEVIDSMETEPTAAVPEKKLKAKKSKIPEAAGDRPEAADSSDSPVVTQEKKKKLKKFKKQKAEESSEPNENDSNNNEEVSEQKTKKLKKKKRSKSKSSEPSEGEPASKVKKEVKPEVIAEDLENLRIGDNAHTLINLLDEMTVVDKDKKKKNKLRRKKDKSTKQSSVSSSETADLEKIEEGKEKIKWKKRKWNKDKKDVNDDLLATSVVVENLPLKIMCSYKKLLADHFGKLGLIKRIGIAELYPTEDPKPVFTTTIHFYSDGAASKALEEDNTLFEGSRIRIKRPLPPTETTVVVRSYAELTEQSLCSVFTSAGRIRSIRHSVKGKKSMSTAFIEFDGPEAVERAIKMAEDAKIGGKKIHASKFELRASRRKEIKKQTADSANEGDSEDSND